MQGLEKISFLGFVKCIETWCVSIVGLSLNLNVFIYMYVSLDRYLKIGGIIQVKMRQANILYFYVGILALLSGIRVQAEDSYRYYTWTVTYGAIPSLNKTRVRSWALNKLTFSYY